MYDAEDVLRAKRFMKRMPCTDLKPGDLVVAEASIVRWPAPEKTSTDHPQDASSIQPDDKSSTSDRGRKQNRYSARTWDTWRVEFRMDALWYLYAGSDYYNAGTGPGEDVEM